jgi:hypothetical protein
MTPVEPAEITRPPAPPPVAAAADTDPSLTEPPPRRRPLRSPAEQAAEQAAADLALLRTFGYADPGLRPDSSPVVSLASPHGPEPEPAPAGDAQPVRFRVLGHDGAAVGRAAVTLLDDRGREAASGTAGADGAGSVDAPRPGAYVLVARAPGHQAVAVAIAVSDGPAGTDLVLTRSASVAGGVYGEDGPIAGARVTLVQDGEIVDAVDSASDGGYRLDDVPAGEYGLSVAAAGCEPFAALLVVPEETAVRQDVELESALAQTEHDDAGSDFPDVADLLRGGAELDPPGR